MTEFKKVEELVPLNNSLRERTIALAGYVGRLRNSVTMIETELEKRCNQLAKAEKELNILLGNEGAEVVPPLLEEKAVIDMVREFFASNPKEEVTAKGLLASLGLRLSSSATVRQSLKRLTEENFLERVAHGLYRAHKNLSVDSKPRVVPNEENK